MAQQLQVLTGPFGRLAVQKADRAVVQHSHPQHHMLVHCGGVETYRYTIWNRECVYDREHMLLINPFEPHACDRVAGEVMLQLALYLEPSWLATVHPAYACDDLQVFTRSSVRLTKALRSDADQLCALALRNARPDPGVTERQLASWLVAIAQTYLVSPSETAQAAPRYRLHDPRIRRALHRILQAPPNTLRIDALSREVGLSRARFYSLFQESTGLTPKAYVHMLCLKQAVDLVVDGDEDLTEISMRLGFQAPQHFSRFFSRALGVAPSDYRRGSRQAMAGRMLDRPGILHS